MPTYTATIQGAGISKIVFVTTSMEEIITLIESQSLEEKHHIKVYPTGGTVSDGITLGTASWNPETKVVDVSKNNEPAYIVVQEGVYRHDIRGAFTTLRQAIEVAKEGVLNDAPAYATETPDHYHAFTVLHLEQNKPVDDADLVCTASWCADTSSVVLYHDTMHRKDI